ncbi:S24 family peptidase [Sinorhizobium meliloti]|uniref:S24 family peptidase n=1 Tax=Rhizobium meliloti TaxID=382 RepID=UPI001F23590E|nr:S24 family peptidase [Sinorhizobium meliloti]
MTDLKTIVEKRLEELGLSPIEAATRAGLERTFLRDIIVGRKKSVRADKMGELARALSLDPGALARNEMVPVGAPGSPTTQRPAPNASFPPRWQQFPGDTSIPLRGHIAAGANGRFILNGQDIARVFCPPGLEGVEGAYAVQVEGRSGEPRFFHGETAWVNPHLKVRQGDDVVVQILEDDEISSYLKRYVSRSSDLLRLYQYNPGEGESHDLEFPSDKVFAVHKVVFHAML